MLGLIGGIVAAFVGILLGFVLRGMSAKAEKALAEQRTQEVAQRAQELAAELNGARAETNAARAETARVQAESAARAGFESLAGERQKALAQLASERDG